MKPGATMTPVGVDAVGVGARQPGHGLEDPVADDDLAGSLAAGGRIDEPGTADLEVGHRALSRAPPAPASR